MRVAIVTISFPPDNKTSPFPASYELAKALVRAGHEVQVLTFTEGETRTDTYENIRVYRHKFDFDNFPAMRFPVAMAFPNCLPHALDLFNGSRKILEEFKPDVIESQEFNGLGLFFALERKYPFVIRVYGPLAHLLRTGTIGKFIPIDVEIVHSLEIAAVGTADGRITLCKDMAQQMANWAGISLADFTVLPTAISPTESTYVFESAARGSAFPRLMYWGRIQRQKGVDLLVEALPAVLAKYPNFQLTVSGQETHEAGEAEPYAIVMRRRLEELGLTDHVEFAGFLSVGDIQKQVSKTDICIFPSRYETACYAAIEAAMYGGCVLATKVGGLPDHIEHGTSGYLIAPESPAALAEGIIKLSEDDQLRADLRQGARADVIARCDPDTNAAKSIEVYKRAIERFGSGGQQSNPAFSNIVQSLLRGMQATPLDDRIYDMLCEKYSEGARAGFDQGFSEGMKTAQTTSHGKRSLVRRIAGKVIRMTQGAIR